MKVRRQMSEGRPGGNARKKKKDNLNNRMALVGVTMVVLSLAVAVHIKGIDLKEKDVNNYCIAVKEQGDDIVFLRKIVKGGADKSYGIQVAKLAGVPAPVIDRAKELVEELSDADITARAKEIAENGPGTQTRKKVAKPDEVDLQQMSIFDTVNEDDIIKEIMELEVNRMSPLDALNTLDKLQAKLKNRWMHQ